MKIETLEKLNAALDAIWIEYGNGYGGEYERLIHELQKCVDYQTQLRLEVLKMNPISADPIRRLCTDE